MTQEKMTELFNQFVQKQSDTLLKKNNDYASADALSNFKSVSGIMNTKPEIIAANLIGVKLARLGVLLNSGKPPSNESILDSVLDMGNYAFLLHCILSETDD